MSKPGPLSVSRAGICQTRGAVKAVLGAPRNPSRFPSSSSEGKQEMLSRCHSFPVPPSAALLGDSKPAVLISTLDFNGSTQELLKSLPPLPGRRVASLKDEISAQGQRLQLEWQRMRAVTLLTRHGEGSM